MTENEWAALLRIARPTASPEAIARVAPELAANRSQPYAQEILETAVQRFPAFAVATETRAHELEALLREAADELKRLDKLNNSRLTRKYIVALVAKIEEALK